jgi:hypothetical protein
MGTERKSRTDKELWRSLAMERDVAPEVISDLDFAAWLEGRLPEAAGTRIERAVAADPELRRAALDLADVLGKPLPAAPARLTVRAQALVGFDVERQVGRGNGWLGRLIASGPLSAVHRAVMAGLMILVAGAGFVMGGGLGDSFAQQRYGSDVQNTASARSTASGEPTDFFVSDGI